MRKLKWEQVLAIEHSFFQAMKSGYAGGDNENKEKKQLEELPGVKSISNSYTISDHNYTVNDMYWVTEGSNYSFGVTTISCDGQPCWHMSYEGEYPKAAIPFLKMSLLENYKEHLFIGGRGPIVFHSEKFPFLLYTNSLTSSPNFLNFAGCEAIYDIANGKKVGYHNFRGGLMFKVEE